jgi:hypothetical protein
MLPGFEKEKAAASAKRLLIKSRRAFFIVKE